MKKSEMLSLLTAVLFIPVIAQVNNAKFYSFVDPDIPTAQDSVFILSKGYISYGGVFDSSFSFSGNNILINYSVVDSIPLYHYTINKKKSIGRLSAGNYRIITTTVFKHTEGSPPLSEGLESDTINFTVVEATAKPAEIVGFSYSNNYPGVGGAENIVGSYYYWNGDTLSVAVGFGAGDINNYIAHLSMQSDTFTIDLADTDFGSPALVQTILCVTSISPVTPGTYPVKINYRSLSGFSGINKIINFNTLTADCKKEGIGISLKNPGTSEFILYLNPVLNLYVIYSPFLDTLKTFSLQPNPHFKVTGTHSIFIGYPSFESLTGRWDPIELWDSTYHKSDWPYTSVQATDHIAYDTLGLGDGTIFRIDYSSDNNDTVLSYTYRTITPFLTSQSPCPSLGFNASFTNPNTNTLKPPVNKTDKQQSLNGLRIISSGEKIRILFHSSTSVVTIRIVDIFGRLISRLEQQTSSTDNGIITAIWDKHDINGRNTARGTYFVLVTAGNRCYSTKMIVAE